MIEAIKAIGREVARRPRCKAELRDYGLSLSMDTGPGSRLYVIESLDWGEIAAARYPDSLVAGVLDRMAAKLKAAQKEQKDG